MIKHYVICIQNSGYEASLEIRKVYTHLDDEESAKTGFVRIVDESGEDYLFPAEYFVPISLPESAQSLFVAA